LHIQDGTFTISKDNIANSEFNELEKGGNEWAGKDIPFL
jgi:hypothetical protein